MTDLINPDGEKLISNDDPVNPREVFDGIVARLKDMPLTDKERRDIAICMTLIPHPLYQGQEVAKILEERRKSRRGGK